MKNMVIFTEYDDHTFIFLNGQMVIGGNWDGGCADNETMEATALNISAAIEDCGYERIDISPAMPQGDWDIEDVEEAVSNVVYAVQYRDMHDAVHRYCYFESIESALKFDASIRNEGVLPYFDDPNECTGVDLINFREPPVTHNGCIIIPVSGATGIPDAW